MFTPANWKQLKRRYEQCPQKIQDYFQHLPRLVSDFPADITLSYLFSRVERAHNTALYCGLVKLHRANFDMADKAIMQERIDRPVFRMLFKRIIGKEISASLSKEIQEAEAIRDKVIHGKRVSEANIRKAVVLVLSYAEGFNSFVSQKAGFAPFGDLRGFKGGAKSVDKSTTRWMLKGFGFSIS